eukprot:1144331-Pelagomonas_calceolata.AAC.4
MTTNGLTQSKASHAACCCQLRLQVALLERTTTGLTQPKASQAACSMLLLIEAARSAVRKNKPNKLSNTVRGSCSGATGNQDPAAGEKEG